jgi:hypothetical protein
VTPETNGSADAAPATCLSHVLPARVEARIKRARAAPQGGTGPTLRAASSVAVRHHGKGSNLGAMSVFGRPFWEEHTRYRRRLLVENAMGRYKGIIDRRLHGRTTASQGVEVRLGCKALNRMARLGLPRHG